MIGLKPMLVEWSLIRSLEVVVVLWLRSSGISLGMTLGVLSHTGLSGGCGVSDEGLVFVFVFVSSLRPPPPVVASIIELPNCCSFLPISFVSNWGEGERGVMDERPLEYDDDDGGGEAADWAHEEAKMDDVADEVELGTELKDINGRMEGFGALFDDINGTGGTGSGCGCGGGGGKGSCCCCCFEW
jgi:hypothetical protein